MERTIAPAPKVLHHRHRGAAKLTLSSRPLVDLSLGTVRDPTFPNRQTTAKKPPKPFAEHDLLLRGEDRPICQRTAKLANEGSLSLTVFRAVRTRKVLDGRITIRTMKGIRIHNRWLFGLLAGVNEEVKNAPCLVFQVEVDVDGGRNGSS